MVIVFSGVPAIGLLQTSSGCIAVCDALTLEAFTLFLSMYLMGFKYWFVLIKKSMTEAPAPCRDDIPASISPASRIVSSCTRYAADSHYCEDYIFHSFVTSLRLEPSDRSNRCAALHLSVMSQKYRVVFLTRLAEGLGGDPRARGDCLGFEPCSHVASLLHPPKV